MPSAANRRSRHLPVASARRALLAVLVLFGLVAMHQLAGFLGTPAHAAHGGDHVAAEHTAATPAHDEQQPCDHDQPCPERGHGHAGQVCQPGVPSHAAPVPPVLSSVAVVPPTYRCAVSPRTAVDTCGGTGCGPPSLTELSISRT